MRLLLDTHAFLWFVSNDVRLSSPALHAISEPNAEVYVSLATMWEVAIKRAKGRLDVSEDPRAFFESEMTKNGFEFLPLQPSHVFLAAALPSSKGHLDPFDRALVAQAICEDLVLVSNDEKLERYDVERLW